MYYLCAHEHGHLDCLPFCIVKKKSSVHYPPNICMIICLRLIPGSSIVRYLTFDTYFQMTLKVI